MKYSLIFLSLLSLSACYEEPEFPVEPFIEFEQVRFNNRVDSSDILSITVSFRDGDGNLGLAFDEIAPPFHPYSFVEFNGPGQFLKLGDVDTLPPYNCQDYLQGYFTGSSADSFEEASVADTVYQNGAPVILTPEYFYVKRNPFHSNFFVEYYIVENGEERLFDFALESGQACGDADKRRFYPFSDVGDPISGSITYKQESRAFIPFFSNDSIKIKVRIADRALNLSNVVESPVFTLQQISIN